MTQVLSLALLLLLSTGVASAAQLPASTPSLSIPSATVPIPQPAAVQGRDVYHKVEGTISGPPAPRLTESDYPTPLGESRLVIWIVAQQHLYWGAFVLGTCFIATLLEFGALIGPTRQNAKAYDALARECLHLVMLAVAVAAILGGLLLISLLALYPDLMSYLVGVFRPAFLLYGVLILAFTLLSALYFVTWHRMHVGWSKWLHASLGVLVNVVGTAIAFIGNAWSSFMLPRYVPF